MTGIVLSLGGEHGNLDLYTVELTVWLGRLANVISIKIKKEQIL